MIVILADALIDVAEGHVSNSYLGRRHVDANIETAGALMSIVHIES